MRLRSPGPAAAGPPAPPGPRPTGGAGIALLAVTLAWGALFAPQLFGSRIFVAGDVATYRPYAEFSSGRWRTLHRRTFWNPYVFAGIPATASLADGRPQYLPDPVLDAYERLMHARLWPPLGLPLIAHLLGMLAAAGLARALWGGGTAAMAWAGLAWGLTPNLLVPFAFGHDAQFVSASIMPVVLWLVHRLFAARDGRGAAGVALGLAPALAVQALAGHPQIVAYSAALAAAFALERARRFRRPRRLLPAALAAGVAAALSAVVWWPALLYSAQSIRGGERAESSLAAAAVWSQAPRDLLALAWPWAVGFGGPTYWGGLRQTDYPQYAGALVLLFAALAWSRSGRGDRSAAWLFAGAGAIAVALSLGTNLGPLYRLLQSVFPLLSRFRVAVAVSIVAQLALALLSASGVERWIASCVSRPGGALRRWRWAAFAGAGGLALAALLALTPVGDLYRAAVEAARPGNAGSLADATLRRAALDLAARALLVAGAIAALALPARGGGAARAAPYALLGLLVLDLGSVGLPLLRGATGLIRQVESPPPPVLARLAARDSLYRAFPVDHELLISNHWITWRARSIGGLHGSPARAWDELTSSGIVWRYGVACGLSLRYTGGADLARLDSTYFERLSGPGEPPAWRLREALPRAYAVPRVVALAADRDVLAALSAGDFRADRIAYTTAAAAAADYPGSAHCTVRWIVDEPDRQVVDLGAPGPAFLVIADAFFPGWSARVDGRPAPLYRVDHLVRGLPVPAGRHRVTLEYEPEGWRSSRRVACAAAAVWLLGALAWLGSRAGRARVARA